MNYYKAGLEPVYHQPMVGASEKQGASVPAMAIAGVLAGLVLMAISKASTKTPKLTVSREAQAHHYAVSRFREKGLPWS